MKHGDEGTHSICEQRLKEMGGKSHCCVCEPHEGCYITTSPQQTPQNTDWENAIRNTWDSPYTREKITNIDSRLENTFAIIRTKKKEWEMKAILKYVLELQIKYGDGTGNITKKE